jgi:preprotein translocase subunit SecA
MFTYLLAKILGTANARKLRQIQPIVDQINELEPRMQALTDAELPEQTIKFREQLAQGKSLDDILPEAFALVRETARRTLGQRHYDVQLIGGIVLHQGKIAEMKTGEGKTLTATLPLYLNALSGKGAHLVTVNDYLARRDASWMKPIYETLGITVGVIQHGLNDNERKNIYNCDIIYATNNEIGFDYLRDNMKFRIDQYVQRGLHYAIVDEVDSILIDEARTPLIISGSSNESSKLYEETNRVIARLKQNDDYEVDEKARSVQLTEQGIDKVEQSFGISNLYAVDYIKLVHHVNQALRAYALFRRDVDYMVRDNEVLIVDEFTGRILPGRRYSDGLHQALEAKEGVTIERESQTLASITLQNLFRLYKKLAGMTGTASTEAEEFHNIYKLDVISIPTSKPMIRLDQPDLIFLTKRAKNKAIIEDIAQRHKKNQPILVGTISIEMSELLSNLLAQHGVPHQVLNAKHHAREAEIIAYAGEPGRVTIATNMAGRGTDIKLTPESIVAGGLYILGTERHESRRIDNQLRGRSGRQGDPGESRFYLSLEDELIRIFGGGGTNLKATMERVGMTEDETVESKIVSNRIEDAQEKIEKQNFDNRKHILEFDDVLNQQRGVVYAARRAVLEGKEQIFDFVRDLINDAVSDLIAQYAPQATINEEEFKKLQEALTRMTDIPVTELSLEQATNTATLSTLMSTLLLNRYERYTTASNKEMMQEAQKWLILESIDQAWKQHMLNLEHLKEGINLRSWGQKTPLLEYKREAFVMFEDMMRSVRFDIVHHIFHLDLERFNTVDLERKREQELQHLDLKGIEGTYEETGGTKTSDPHKIVSGRNDPCPCGSGKKYKKCCGK